MTKAQEVALINVESHDFLKQLVQGLESDKSNKKVDFRNPDAITGKPWMLEKPFLFW